MKDLLEKIIICGSWILLALMVVSLLFYAIGVKIYGFMVLIVIALFLFFSKRNFRKSKIDYGQIGIFVIILIVSILNYVFHHEPLMADHDVGEFAVSAIMYSYFGEVTYHGFPTYSILLSLPVQVSSVFDIYVMITILVFFSLGLIYYFSKRTNKKSYLGLASVLLVSCSYPFLWFFRRTLTETLWFFLFFMSIYYMGRFQETKKTIYLYYLFSPAILSLLVRTEAYIFVAGLIGYCCLIYFFDKKRVKVKELFSHNINYTIFLLIIAGLFLFFFIQTGEYEYVTSPISKAIVNTFQNTGIEVSVSHEVDYDTRSPTYRNFLPRYIIDTFDGYGLLLYVMTAFIALIYFLRTQKIKELLYNRVATISFIALVFLVFFMIEPSTGFTQPWFLRHFWVPIITVSLVIFPSIVKLYFKDNFVRGAILILSVVSLISISQPLVFATEYRGSHEIIHGVSQSMYEEDFLLSHKKTLLLTEETMYRNYGKSMAYLLNADLKVLSDSSQEELLTYDRVFAYVRGKRPLVAAGVLEGKFLEEINCSVLKTKRLAYDRAAHEYAENWKYPAAHLAQGYGGFVSTVENLPIQEWRDWSIHLCLYEIR